MFSKGYVIGSKAGAGALLDGIMDRQSATGVSARATGQTLIFTAVSDRGRFIATGLILEVLTVDATEPTTAPAVSLGTVALPEKFQVNSTCWANLTQVGMVQRWRLAEGSGDTTPAWSLALSEGMYLNVCTAAAGPVLTWRVHVLGFYAA